MGLSDNVVTAIKCAIADLEGLVELAFEGDEEEIQPVTKTIEELNQILEQEDVVKDGDAQLGGDKVWLVVAHSKGIEAGCLVFPSAEGAQVCAEDWMENEFDDPIEDEVYIYEINTIALAAFGDNVGPWFPEDPE